MSQENLDKIEKVMDRYNMTPANVLDILEWYGNSLEDIIKEFINGTGSPVGLIREK